MDTALIILLIVLIIAICIAGVLIYKKLNNPQTNKESEEKILNLQNLLIQLGESSKITREQIENVNKTTFDQIDKLRKTFDEKLDNSNKTMHGHLEKSIETIKNVTEQLENLKGTNKQILDLSGQIRGLEDVLKNPKQRGILGEYFLETLLKNLFSPSQYEMQYKFSSDGEIVDAVVFYDNKIIPIDSKFSLENYNRLAEEKDPKAREEIEKRLRTDLKTRIDETSKYIRPTENTVDFAFMFIPAEGVYYDLLVNRVGSLNINSKDLIEYAFRDKHVIIVSPTSFFAYLQTVLQGLKNVDLQNSVQKIVDNVMGLENHLKAYDEYMQKLGNNLGTTVNMYNSAYKEFKKIDKDIARVDGGKGIGVEPVLLEKPNVE